MEHLNLSSSFELAEDCVLLRTASSIKGSFVSCSKGNLFEGDNKQKALRIISSNIEASIPRTDAVDLRQKYRKLKKTYIKTASKPQKIEKRLVKCKDCKESSKANQDTKQALEESIAFTSLLLQELQKFNS